MKPVIFKLSAQCYLLSPHCGHILFCFSSNMSIYHVVKMCLGLAGFEFWSFCSVDCSYCQLLKTSRTVKECNGTYCTRQILM